MPNGGMGHQQQIQSSSAGSNNKLKDATMAAFRNCTDMEAGCNIADVINIVMNGELKNSIQPKDISKMIESLSDDGMIYSTIDDLHFLPSE
jgi:hypothetical protein